MRKNDNGMCRKKAYAVCCIGGYEMNIKREANGHFAPGVSANPGGKAKMPDEVKAALRAASPEAVALLVEVMQNPHEKTAYRLEAAKTILDRAYGKPMQAQDISFDVNNTADVLAQIRRVAMEQENDGQRDSSPA